LTDVWLTGKTANTTTDLLPAVKEGFNARRKLKHAIDAGNHLIAQLITVRLANRLKALSMSHCSSDEEESSGGPVRQGSRGSDKKLSPSTTAFAEVVRAARLKAEEDAALAAKTV
jgi:hypothetical protein